MAEANPATAKGSRLAANASVAVAKARSAQASTGERVYLKAAIGKLVDTKWASKNFAAARVEMRQMLDG